MKPTTIPERLLCWAFRHRPVADRTCPTLVSCARCRRCLGYFARERLTTEPETPATKNGK